MRPRSAARRARLVAAAAVSAVAGLLRQLYGGVARADGGAGDPPLCEADSVPASW